MSRGGPGETHGIATWVGWKDKSASETDASALWAVGKQKLEAFLRDNPDRRPEAAEIYHAGKTDPRYILHWLAQGPGAYSRTFAKARGSERSDPPATQRRFSRRP